VENNKTHLVDNGRVLRYRLDDRIDKLLGEVRNSNALDLASLDKSDDRLPGVDHGCLAVDLDSLARLVLGEEVLSRVALGDEGNRPVD
jgi:hypothetical protein